MTMTTATTTTTTTMTIDSSRSTRRPYGWFRHVHPSVHPSGHITRLRPPETTAGLACCRFKFPVQAPTGRTSESRRKGSRTMAPGRRMALRRIAGLGQATGGESGGSYRDPIGPHTARSAHTPQAKHRMCLYNYCTADNNPSYRASEENPHRNTIEITSPYTQSIPNHLTKRKHLWGIRCSS